MEDLKRILQSVRDGNQQSLVLLLQRFKARIRAAMASAIPDTLRHVIDLNDQDLDQQLFIDLCHRLKHVDPDRAETIESWLATVAQNVVRDAVRIITASRKNVFRIVRAPAGDVSGDWLAQMAITLSSESPSRIISRNELIALTRQAITELPEIYRDAITLHDLDGLTVGETATALKISVSAAKMRLCRGRELLTDQLGFWNP